MPILDNQQEKIEKMISKQRNISYKNNEKSQLTLSYEQYRKLWLKKRNIFYSNFKFVKTK